MRDRLLFSYATHDDPALKRLAIRTIERAIASPQRSIRLRYRRRDLARAA